MYFSTQYLIEKKKQVKTACKGWVPVKNKPMANIIKDWAARSPRSKGISSTKGCLFRLSFYACLCWNILILNMNWWPMSSRSMPLEMKPA